MPVKVEHACAHVQLEPASDVQMVPHGEMVHMWIYISAAGEAHGAAMWRSGDPTLC